MTDKDRNIKLSAVDNLAEVRLWKSLDSISDKLTGIEGQLSDLVVIKERVNTHDQVLSRYGNRLDDYEFRIRESEIWQANNGDRSTTNRMIKIIQKDVEDLKIEVDNNTETKNIDTGKKHIVREIIKWVAAIVAAMIIFKATQD